MRHRDAGEEDGVEGVARADARRTFVKVPQCLFGAAVQRELDADKPPAVAKAG
jgi:hypothetical protein